MKNAQLAKLYLSLTVVFVLAGVASSDAAYGETRGFVLYYLHTATHGDKRNCPNGDNGGYAAIKTTAFKLHGFSQEKIARILGGEIGPMSREMLDITTNRGRVDGKPANVFHNPLSAPDPHIKMVQGPEAYGFNLDGKGGEAPYAFTDPETGEEGVDNQLYRVVGCFTSYDESLPIRPNHEKQIWSLYGYRMSAWLFSITTDDFNRDGPATVSFYKAIDRRRHDASGGTLYYATYVIDPNPRNRAEFAGVIKDGVFTSAANDVSVFLTGAPENSWATKLELSKARLRLRFNTDGSAFGYLAGYQPWMDFWFMMGVGNEQSSLDTVGLYYGLQKMADAQPDPNTGKNTEISTTYRLDAAPAFIARPDGTLITENPFAAKPNAHIAGS